MERPRVLRTADEAGAADIGDPRRLRAQCQRPGPLRQPGDLALTWWRPDVGPRARGSRRQRLEITLLVTPALVLYASFVLVPIGMAFYYSGFKWNGLRR